MIPTARNLLTRPPTGMPGRAICPGEGLLVFPTSPSGEQPDCPSLRASSDHCFIVGALRARRAPGRSPPPFSEACETIQFVQLREHHTDITNVILERKQYL